MTRPKVGLALGGGGARGYAHLGVIRTLHQFATIAVDIDTGEEIVSTARGAGSACHCRQRGYLRHQLSSKLSFIS